MSTPEGEFVKPPFGLLPVVGHEVALFVEQSLSEDPLLYQPHPYDMTQDNPLLQEVAHDLALDVLARNPGEANTLLIYAKVAHVALVYQAILDSEQPAAEGGDQSAREIAYGLPRLTPAVIGPVFEEFESNTYFEHIYNEMHAENPNLAYIASRIADKFGGRDNYGRSKMVASLVHGLLRTQAIAQRDSPIIAEEVMPYPLPVVPIEASVLVLDKVLQQGPDYYERRFSEIIRAQPDVTNYIQDFIGLGQYSGNARKIGLIGIAVTTVHDLLAQAHEFSGDTRRTVPALKLVDYKSQTTEIDEVGIDQQSGLLRARIAYHNPWLNRIGRAITLGLTDTVEERHFMRGVFNLAHEAFYRQAVLDTYSTS